MDKQAFLVNLAEVLQMHPDEINETVKLTPENWDSTAILETIALIDEQFEIIVPTNELNACRSVAELLAVIQKAMR